MALFDNGDPEDSLFFIWKFNMTLEASGTLKAGVKVKYLRTLVRGKALRQFDALSAEVEGYTPLTLEYIILGLGANFSC